MVILVLHYNCFEADKTNLIVTMYTSVYSACDWLARGGEVYQDE